MTKSCYSLLAFNRGDQRMMIFLVNVFFSIGVLLFLTPFANAAFPASTISSDEYAFGGDPWSPTIGEACRVQSVTRSVSGWAYSTDPSGPWCTIYQPNGQIYVTVGGSKRTVTNYTCPASATRSGTTCTCNAGYLQNVQGSGCYQTGPQGEIVDVDLVCKSGGCGFGNPIYPLTGSKKESIDTGWSVGGGSLVLTYDSIRQMAATSAGVGAKDYGDTPSFGALWFSSLHRKLLISSSGYGIKSYRGDGTIINFRNQSGVYIADADSADQLTSFTGGYRYVDANSRAVETYNSKGQLTSLADIAGNTLTFNYSTVATSSAPAAGYLTQVTDNTGRKISFEYELAPGESAATDGKISKISNTAGQAIVAAYTTTGNLISLTWEDGKVRQFLYEHVSLPWALTGVVDENNSRLSTFGYDAEGRAISTERAGSVDRYTASYVMPPSISTTDVFDPATQITYRYREWRVPSAIAVESPNGQSLTLGASAVLGKPLLTSMSQPAGSGCTAANNASTYDASGNLSSRDDFQGRRSCYLYDSANRETVRVEGLPTSVACSEVTASGATLPTGARKITTSWHTDWKLPVHVDEPGRRTTTVYHGQPDPFNGNAIASCTAAPAMPHGKPLPLVCKAVEQAMLVTGSVDSSVPAQTMSYSYNSSGRLLSSVDPRSQLTAYAYFSSTQFSGVAPSEIGHTAGDLQSITNAAGHVTQFTQYDRAGRVRQMIDPKGVVTDISYTPRGWVSTVSTTAPGASTRVTSYTYDGVGQLTGVAHPDGSSLSYSYDAAHRLVGVTDAKGNSISYTLDNAGNRTAEEIKDPNGVLQRSISRSFDALNRVQQVTGAIQ